MSNTIVKSDVVLVSSKKPIRLVIALPTDDQKLLDAIQPDRASNLSFFNEPLSLERQRAYLDRMFASKIDWLLVIEDATDGRPIGTVGLHEVDDFNKTGRLGMLIFSDQDRGKGFGSEAIRLLLKFGFEELCLNKIYLSVFSSNYRSKGIYTRLGFKIEGTLRQEYLLNDVFHDMLRMSMLKEEYPYDA